ncbi:MAG TPA: EAL domain-containing response regulator [Ramlibacter sp.]|nr:EAL domain-containing response regulator [Ramlibacter sp.]
MQLSTVRFLVVEDHDVQRRLLVQILSNLGAVLVQDAEDGHAALRIIGEADPPIDIMITDLSMPGMDGIELVRHVGEGASGVSIILTSALEPRLLASVANMAQAYNVKVLGMLKKPPSAVKLAPLIQQYLAAKAAPAGDATEELTLSAIAGAFVRDEFEPHFEPTVSLSTLDVEGMHAVPAWRHPERGLLQADEFMPAVKSFGLADDIVWMMLRKCAAQAAAWKAAGLGLKVAVPLSLESLADLELAGRVEKVVLREGAQPGNIVLGIGKTAVDEASARALENMVRLRMLGFELAVDEFGTGSMATDQLARVAFNSLKFDRNFGKASSNSTRPWADLAVALEAAEQLKLLAVAHGIATPDDWNLLQELQCELGQGPLISGPMPGPAVAQWLESWPPKPQRGVWTPMPMM